MLRKTLLAATLLALAACAAQSGTQTAATPAADRDCFRNDDIHGYSVVDNHTVSVRAGSREYLLSTGWNVRDLDWTQTIAIRAPSGWICTGNGLGVDIIGGQPQRTFPIQSVARAPEPPAVEGS